MEKRNIFQRMPLVVFVLSAIVLPLVACVVCFCIPIIAFIIIGQDRTTTGNLGPILSLVFALAGLVLSLVWMIRARRRSRSVPVRQPVEAAGQAAFVAPETVKVADQPSVAAAEPVRLLAADQRVALAAPSGLALADGRLVDPNLVEWKSIPWYRRGWWPMLILMIIAPVGVVNLWTGEIFIRRKGNVQTMTNRTKLFLSVLFLFAWVFRALRALYV